VTFRVDSYNLRSWMRSEILEVFDGTQKLGQDGVIPPTVSWLGRVGRDVGHQVVSRLGGCDVVEAVFAEDPDVI
jgi:hypothetical protein